MEKKNSSLAAILFALLVPVAFAIVLIIPQSREWFISATNSQPYIMGFVKFALLATAGEIIANRISQGRFCFAKGAPAKAAIWGLIGIMMALLIPVYSAGVAAAQLGGFLPLFANETGNSIFAAICTSIIMNLTFGIAMMAFHRVTDTMIELKCDKKPADVRSAVSKVDWTGFVGFVVLRTLPIFWIPMHSVTFSLPGQFRVIVSAALSMVLGTILALAKKKSAKPAAK